MQAREAQQDCKLLYCIRSILSARKSSRGEAFTGIPGARGMKHDSRMDGREVLRD